MVFRKVFGFKSVIKKEDVRFRPCATKISGTMQQKVLGGTHKIHCPSNAKIYMA